MYCTQKYHVARYLGFQTIDIHFSTQIIIQLGGVTFYFEMIQILLDLCLLFPNRDGLSHVLAQNFILVMVSFITYCYFIRQFSLNKKIGPLPVQNQLLHGPKMNCPPELRNNWSDPTLFSKVLELFLMFCYCYDKKVGSRHRH